MNPSYLPATWRTVQAACPQTGAIPLGFDLATGETIRLLIPRAHAEQLAGALQDALTGTFSQAPETSSAVRAGVVSRSPIVNPPLTGRALVFHRTALQLRMRKLQARMLFLKQSVGFAKLRYRALLLVDRYEECFLPFAVVALSLCQLCLMVELQATNAQLAQLEANRERAGQASNDGEGGLPKFHGKKVPGPAEISSQKGGAQ